MIPQKELNAHDICEMLQETAQAHLPLEIMLSLCRSKSPRIVRYQCNRHGPPTGGHLCCIGKIYGIKLCNCSAALDRFGASHLSSINYYNLLPLMMWAETGKTARPSSFTYALNASSASARIC